MIKRRKEKEEEEEEIERRMVRKTKKGMMRVELKGSVDDTFHFDWSHVVLAGDPNYTDRERGREKSHLELLR